MMNNGNTKKKIQKSQFLEVINTYYLKKLQLFDNLIINKSFISKNDSEEISCRHVWTINDDFMNTIKTYVFYKKEKLAEFVKYIIAIKIIKYFPNSKGCYEQYKTRLWTIQNQRD